MAHEITETDLVLSTTSAEWHGLAKVVDKIDDESIKPLLFDILEEKTYVKVRDREILVPNRKTLVADLSPRTGYAQDSPYFLPEEKAMVAMHSPKESYQIIPNRDIWEGLKRSIHDTGAKVVTAGTLCGCSRFFVSVDIGGSETKINGDDFKAYLNFITSHDGTLAAQAYDSEIRVICNNTLVWSLNAAGEVGFKVYHTKNAPMGMQRFPELLNAILSGRVDFKNQMEYLASVPITFDDAKHIVLAFLVGNSASGGVSGQAINMSEEVQNLFRKGIGNKGQTLYDLFNGFTEAYTHGGGVGKKSKDSVKYYKSNFGAASEKKHEFTNFLLGMDVILAKQTGEKYSRKFEEMKLKVSQMVG
jgi:hypothetical protein